MVKEYAKNIALNIVSIAVAEMPQPVTDSGAPASSSFAMNERKSPKPTRTDNADIKVLAILRCSLI